MKLDITRNGETTEVEVDVSLDRMSLQESVRLEEAVGEVAFDRMQAAAEAAERGEEFDPRGLQSPKIIQAILWAKLATLYPGLSITEFDIDMESLAEVMEASDGVVIPMTTSDGETTQGHSEPTVAAGNG